MYFSIITLAVIVLLDSSQAGVIGDYGGHFGSDIESHDFSDDSFTKGASAHYESLGSLGDHLDESHFPSDFDESQKGDEYAEGSEHIEIGEPYHEHEHEHHEYEPHHFEHESLHHEIHSEHHDYESKPIPGINHGKGALSYSTTYEFKDPKP